MLAHEANKRSSTRTDQGTSSDHSPVNISAQCLNNAEPASEPLNRNQPNVSCQPDHTWLKAIPCN